MNHVSTFFRMIKRLLSDGYKTFYDPSGSWFLLTITLVVCFYFASLGRSAFAINAFNALILPWQISFVIWAAKGVLSFLKTRWHDAKK